MTQGTDGNFYGTTLYGGTDDAGTVFKITPAGVETVLYSFTGSPANPIFGVEPSGLLQGTDGNFYGTTAYGGANGSGSVFKITPSGVETVLYSFPALSNPENSVGPSGLIQGADGNIYGSTQAGGTNGDGTVFKCTP